MAILWLTALCMLGGAATVTAFAADSDAPQLDGAAILERMASQFRFTRQLVGTVRMCIQHGDTGVEMAGKLQVKGWNHYRFEYEAPERLRGSTIIADGDMAAYYMAGRHRPRIFYKPDSNGFTSATDTVLYTLGQLASTGTGRLIGNDTYLGRPVYLVEIQNEVKSPATFQSSNCNAPVFWVDAGSWLPLRITGLGTPATPVEFAAISIQVGPEEQIVEMTAEIVQTGETPARMNMKLIRFEKDIWFPREVRLQGAEFVVAQEFSDLKFDVSLSDELFYVEEIEIIRSAFARGKAFLAVRNFQAALEEFRKIVRVDPYNVAAHTNLGYAYVGLGDEAGAIAEFEQVIMLEPEAPIGYNNLAYIYIDGGVYVEEGLEMARKAVSLSPENGAFRDTLGWGYYQLGDYDAAVAELTRAIALMATEKPWDRALAHYHLGMAYARQQLWEKARLHLEKALELDPSLEKARRELQSIDSFTDCQQRIPG